MEDPSIFIQQGTNFQFLSACHYITILGVYFYNNDLIKLEEKSQSVQVLNTLFDYIDKSGNATQTKYQILKKVLKGSDLYGGGENETLDMKYVDETYHYIISTVLFSHYGNINGYLAKIVNEADNVNYLAFKEMILRHLSERYITKEYCSSGNFSSRLSPLAIDKVYQEHILPIFPEPEENISILDVSYIYAMVGLKIVKSITAEETYFTFKEYILIAREIDSQDLNSITDEMVLKLFQIPALFFYAFNYKENFKKTDLLVLTDEFWKEAFEKLFSYINSSMRRIVNDNLEKSLHHKLERQLSKLQSRTSIAITVLQVYCKYERPLHVSYMYVAIYKTLYKWLTKLLLPNSCDSEIPDLETVYNEQFKEVEKTYNEIERNSIEKVLVDSNLLDIMDVNSTVKLGQLPLPSTMGCHLCSPIPREMNKDIYLLFTIIRENEDSNYYALRQVNNTLSLLSSNRNDPNFAKTVANDSSLKMDTGLIPTTLKFKHEDYKLFVQRVADKKTKQFINGLKRYYYEETLGEKYLKFFKSLIPFYNCIESATTGRGGEAAFSCSLDVLSLIPFAGLAAKYTTKITSSLTTNIGNMFLLTNTLAKTGIITKLPLMASLKQIAKMAARTIAEEILNRNLVKDLVVTSLRTLDPGIELFYKVSKFGLKKFSELFQNIVSSAKNYFAVETIKNFLKHLLQTVKQKKNLVSDLTGLVPVVTAERDGYNIVRYIYPGGSQFFGPRCVASFGRTAELRTIDGYSFQVPVLAITNPGSTAYKQYLPETGEISKFKLKMDDNDILHRIGYLIDNMVVEGHNVNILRNYHVYHNTMDWKKTPTQEAPSQNLNQPIERNNALQYQESFLSYLNTRENAIQQNYQSITNTQFQGSSQANTEIVKIEQNPSQASTSLHFSNSQQPVKLGDNIPPSDGTLVSPKVVSNTDSSSLSNTRTTGTKRDRFSSSNTEVAEETNIPQKIRRVEIIGNPEITLQYIHKKFDVKIPGAVRRVQIISERPSTLHHEQNEDLIIEDNNRNIDTKSTLNDFWNRMANPDVILGTSRKVTGLNPEVYKNIIKDPTYTRYSEILTMWKETSSTFIRKDIAQIYFLRKTVNSLALLQLDRSLLMPNTLWCVQIVKEQKKIDFLRSLIGKEFFFNDITLLTNNYFEILTNNKIGKFSLKTQVHYHLTIDSPYGFVDLTNFHEKLQNNYVTFSDIFFTVTSTYFSENKRILNIVLKQENMSKDNWMALRQQDLKNLEVEKRNIDSPRMKRISEAANVFVEEGLLSTFQSSTDFLLNYILSTKQKNYHIVPTYSMLVADVLKGRNMKSYDNWKIKSNAYIQDVLTKKDLDNEIDLSVATSRIHEVYDSVYFQNIEEAFRNYRRIPDAEQRFRFEDYYVLHSYIKNRLLINQDGMRRLEAAINRLALRQCGEDWISNPIALYRTEFIPREMSQRLYNSFFKEHIVAFDQMKRFSRSAAVEVVNCLNRVGRTSEIPLVMEARIKNQAGIADIRRALNDATLYHIVTADFQFMIDEIYYRNMFGHEVLYMKIRDYQNPTEGRMVRMANRLYELFSENTKFYSRPARTLE